MGLIDPLRPISSTELDEAVSILKSEKKLDQNYKFITVRDYNALYQSQLDSIARTNFTGR